MFLKLNPVQYNVNIFQNRDLFEREQQVMKKMGKVQWSNLIHNETKCILSNMRSKCETFVTGTPSTTCECLIQ